MCVVTSNHVGRTAAKHERFPIEERTTAPGERSDTAKRGIGLGQLIDVPPSTGSEMPVMKDASSE